MISKFWSLGEYTKPSGIFIGDIRTKRINAVPLPRYRTVDTDNLPRCIQLVSVDAIRLGAGGFSTGDGEDDEG